MQCSWCVRLTLTSGIFEIFLDQTNGTRLVFFSLRSKLSCSLLFLKYCMSVTSNHLSTLSCDRFSISLLCMSYLIVGILLLDRCSTLDRGHNKQHNPILPLCVIMTTRQHAVGFLKLPQGKGGFTRGGFCRLF